MVDGQVPVGGQDSGTTQGPGQAVEGPQDHEDPGLIAPSNLALWAFVAVQIALILVDVFFLRFGTSPLAGSLTVGGVLNLACLFADATALRVAGYRVPVYLYIVGFLIVPLYLILRIRLTKQSWWPLVAWAGVFAAGIAATPLVGYVGGVELDGAAVESSIEDWYANEGGTSIYESSVPVDLHCPSTLIVPVGETFTCEADGLDGTSETIVITVDSWQGDLSWQQANG